MRDCVFRVPCCVNSICLIYCASIALGALDVGWPIRRPEADGWVAWRQDAVQELFMKLGVGSNEVCSATLAVASSHQVLRMLFELHLVARDPPFLTLSTQARNPEPGSATTPAPP